ncbi:MAG: VanZ family protein [Chthoniobacterales bacterium]
MPPIAWMLVIFAASTDLGSAEHTSRFLVPFLRWLVPDLSYASIATVQFFVRKAGHVSEYAILGALLWRALSGRSTRPHWHYALLALLVAGGYAALDEFHQAFVQSRTGNPRDALIDLSGAALGLSLWWLVSRWRQPRAVAAPV